MRFFAEFFIVLISDSNKALELQTMECIVPIIADKIARWIVIIIQGLSGKTMLSMLVSGAFGSVKCAKGIERINDAINNIYIRPTITIE